MDIDSASAFRLHWPTLQRPNGALSAFPRSFVSRESTLNITSHELFEISFFTMAGSQPAPRLVGLG